MIAVTCRNGEHFAIDPDAIERVETANDTVVHMVDGSKYVIDQPLDALICAVRDHRAAAFVARIHLVDGCGETTPATRNARRLRPDAPIAVLPDAERELDHHPGPDPDEA